MRSGSLELFTPFTPLCVLALSSCTPAMVSRTTSDVLSSVVLAGTPTGPRPGAAGPSAPAVIERAEDYIGVPYRWGGTSPRTGFDCSGYVRYVYAQQGVQLPRTSREQANAGERVTPRISALRQGDLMLFAERTTISHVAIYAGGGRIIHSSSSGGGVRYDDLATRRGKWFAQHMVAARRLAVDGRSLVQALDLLTRRNMPLDPPDHAPPPQ